jgi:NADH:ubiquinone oxidoreductase subunit H
VLGITFTTYVGLSMLVFCGGLLPALTADIDMLLFLALSGLLGCLCVVPMVIATNRYSSIGCLRQLRALILADIGLDTGLILLVLLFVSLDSGSNAMTIAPNAVIYTLVFIPLFILVLISSARAPFDLPEAESELVSGTLTEVGGTAFSLCLLLDYLEVLT